MPAAAPAPALEVAWRTDPGRDPDKQVNEDALAQGLTPLGHLLVVCDGMGGHAGGREASRIAIEAVREIVGGPAAPGEPPAARLRAAIEEAGRRVHAFGAAFHDGPRPGSTCVAVIAHGRGAEVAHVGDSRAYLVRAGEIFPLTRDHSVVQKLVDAGLLQPEDASSHPDANQILRALGVAPTTDVDVREAPVALGRGDVLLLCSDGLTDLVRDDEMAARVARAPALQAACDALVDLANARGGHDNITVLLARALGAAPEGTGGAPPPPPSARAGARTVVQTGPGGTTVPGTPAPTVTLPGKATVIDESLARSGPARTLLEQPAPSMPAQPVTTLPGTPMPPASAAMAPSGAAPPPTPTLPGTPAPPGMGRSTTAAEPARGAASMIVVAVVVAVLIVGGVLVWWAVR